MPQFPSSHKGCDAPGQPLVQGWKGGVRSPQHPPTTLPRLAAAGRGGGEHFPGVIGGGAVKPPQPALPHRPTVPRPWRSGERDGQKPTAPPWLLPPPSSPSALENGPDPGGPRSPLPGGGGAPTTAPPRWGSGHPHRQRGCLAESRGSDPRLCSPPPPQCRDLIHPKWVLVGPPQHWALPQCLCREEMGWGGEGQQR